MSHNVSAMRWAVLLTTSLLCSTSVVALCPSFPGLLTLPSAQGLRLLPPSRTAAGAKSKSSREAALFVREHEQQQCVSISSSSIIDSAGERKGRGLRRTILGSAVGDGQEDVSCDCGISTSVSG